MSDDSVDSLLGEVPLNPSQRHTLGRVTKVAHVVGNQVVRGRVDYLHCQHFSWLTWEAMSSVFVTV
jgi:hypothetical protein